jgi:chromosome segregation ATPase
MNFTNILLILALFLSVSNATKTSYEFASSEEVNELSQSSYGRSLLETVSLTLKSDGDVSSVQKLLDDLLFKLNKDQEAADAAWTKENARLKAKIARLTKEIKRLRKEIARLVVERTKYTKLVARVLVNLTQYRKQLAANNKQITALTKTRGEDAADYKRSQDEHMDIINAITTVVGDLKTLVGSISGKGKPASVSEISEEKRDRLAASFLEISKDDEEVAIFVEMATEADQKSLAKLIKLLLKLRESTRKSYNEDTTSEKKSKRIFKTLVEILKKDITKLGAMIVTSNKNLKTYRKKIVSLTAEIGVKTRLRNNKKGERKVTVKERMMKKKQWEEDSRERKSEMVVVRRLQKIVKTRLASMSSYLKKETNA